jgi:hypothetical protein
MLVCTADAAPVPWKNGGGVTRELLRLPADAADWTLRISVADIAADGPFSAFEGITRWFAVLEGAGVRLRWPRHAVHLRAGDAPLRFDGAQAPDCTLLGGATRDLNVMVRRDRADALVAPALPGDEARPDADTGFGFFSLRPLVLHGVDAGPARLPAFALAWRDPTSRTLRPWRVEPREDSDAAQAHTPAGYWIHLLPTAP